VDLFFRTAFASAWGILVLVWAAGWLTAKPTSRKAAGMQSLTPYLPLLIGFALVELRVLPRTWIAQHLWPRSLIWETTGLALTMLGATFAIWARVTLGRNWSSVPQVKEKHELIVKGPYRLVRHPIYTGLLLAVAGTGLAGNQGMGLLIFVLLFASYTFKIRLEERLMIETFPETYPDYRRRVKALIPFVL
jgi:protein-S-isoprenylcysteine O-methyltransferase Ste14